MAGWIALASIGAFLIVIFALNVIENKRLD